MKVWAFTLLTFCLCGYVAAEQVQLAWDANPEPDIAGYRIKYGTSAAVYEQTVDVGNVTTATLTDLVAGATYYAAATAYNTDGLESELSTEISFVPAVPPVPQPPIVSLTGPLADPNLIAPADIVITADASDPDGTIAKVVFYSGSTQIGEATAAPYTITWRGVSAGSYSISATAYDNTGLSSSTDGSTITVRSPLPASPADTAAAPVSSTQINVTWSAASGATSYSVSRSLVSGGPYVLVAADVGQTTFSDLTCSPLTTYHYVVTAKNSYGQSSPSAQATATTPGIPVPPAPTALGAIGGELSATLTWQPSPGAVAYAVKRSSSSGGPYTTIASGITATSYTDGSLTGGTTYYYVVSAINSSGESANSAETSAAVTAPAKPVAPQDLTATAGDAQVTLTWSAVDTANSYNIKRAASGGTFVLIATGVIPTSFVDKAVTNGSSYQYVVSAVNAGGEGGNSLPVSVTPGFELPSPWVNQDIGSVAAAGNATYQNGSFTILGSGANIGGKSDEFQYVYQSATGDCEIVTRIASVENTDRDAKVGVMIRENLTSKSRYAAVLISAGNGVSFQRRTTTGGMTAVSSVTGIVAPQWLRLTRTAGTFRAYYSQDGLKWIQFGGNRSFTMGTAVWMGMALSSRVDGVLCKAVADNVTAEP